MADGDGGGEVCSADPNDLEVYVDSMDTMRTSFGLRMEALQTSWNAKAAGNSYVSFPAPFDDAGNVAATWKTRSEFVAAVRQAFLDADGYDPQAIDVVYTISAAAIDQALGRTAQTLLEMGVDPNDAETIAAGTPELFDSVVDGYISVEAAVEVAALTPSEQRNVLATDLDSGEIVAVLDNDYGVTVRVALLEGHTYRVRMLMLDEEQRSAVHMSDTLPILLGGDEHLSFEEIEERVAERRGQIVAGYEEAGLSPDEAQAAYDDLVTSVEFLAVNKIARMSLDGAADDDSKPGDPDADNKFSASDARTRATLLLEDGDDSNSQRLWQRSMQARMGTPNIFVLLTDDDRSDALALVGEHTHEASGSHYNRKPAHIATADIAAEIQAIRRTDPERAAAIELVVVSELEGDDRAAFIEQMGIQTRQEKIGYATLADGVDGDVEVDQNDINTEVDRILEETVGTRTGYMGSGPRTRTFNANEAEYQINELAKTDPALALMVKQQLDHQLEPVDVAELNRLLGGGAGWSDNVDSAGNHPWEMAQGASKNFANGFIFIGNQLIDTDIRGQRDGPIPSFELNNSAERGGAVLGTAVEIAFAGKGLVKIGAKWFIRNGDDLTEVVIKNGDDLAPPVGPRTLLPDGTVKPAPAGTPSPAVTADVQAYADAINSNQPWRWSDIAPAVKPRARSAIRAEAKAHGLIAQVPRKPSGHPDFAAANVVRKVDHLPADLWKATDAEQFKWLDQRLPGGVRPKGYLWHHSELTGRMELVERGAHTAYSHSGGRAPGGWADAPRR